MTRKEEGAITALSFLRNNLGNNSSFRSGNPLIPILSAFGALSSGNKKPQKTQERKILKPLEIKGFGIFYFSNSFLTLRNIWDTVVL